MGVKRNFVVILSKNEVIMMKNKILLGCLFLAALLIGCFDDEGTYDYKEINGPV